MPVRRLSAALVATMALGTGLLSVPPASAADGEPTIFTIGMLQDVDSLNPFNGIVLEAFEMWQLQYPTLTDYSADTLAIVPDLAESWEESADKKTWTYRLVPGRAVVGRNTAHRQGRRPTRSTASWMASARRPTTATSPATSSRSRPTDDHTVVMTVKEPSPLMDHLGVYILPEHVWKEIDQKEVKSFANEPEDGEPLVGAGPFLIAERRPGQFIRLVRTRTTTATPRWSMNWCSASTTTRTRSARPSSRARSTSPRS